MTGTPIPGGISHAQDAIEVEIRQCPGVLGVSWEGSSAGWDLRVVVSPGDLVGEVRSAALPICQHHTDEPIKLTFAAIPPVPETPAEAPRLAYAAKVEFDHVELDRSGDVHVRLRWMGKAAQGFARGGNPESPVAAVLDAIAKLGAPIAIALEHVSIMSDVSHSASVLLKKPGGPSDVMGVATAQTTEESAVLATLHAINRLLVLAAAGDRT